MPDENNTQETEQAAPQTQQPDDRSMSEQNLDALDALPSSRRRSATVLGIAGVLFVFCLTVLILMPPLSWKSEKKDQASYVSLTEISQIEPGNGTQKSLSYQQIVEKTVYHLTLDEHILYGEGKQAEVSLETDVILSRPERRDFDDAVTFTLDDVHVKVLDGKDEVKLASIGGMLAGIAVYSRLGTKAGLYTVVPEANINPQVARVLFVFSDVFRQIWIPLPEAAIASGATWHLKDSGEQNASHYRASSVSFTSQDGKDLLDIKTDLFGKKDSRLGDATAHVELQDGRVLSSELDYKRTERAYADGASQLSVHAVLRIKK